MLGRRIKTLRKTQKMTQSEVAEGIMTKSMLSMIENGKATPSLPALQRIAERLHVSVDELLLDPRVTEMKQLLEQIESPKSEYYSEQQIIEMLSPYLDPAVPSYWQGQIYHKYGFALRFLNPEEGLRYFELAFDIFKNLDLRDQQIEVQISKVYFLFFLRRYEEAYQLIDAMMIIQDIPLSHETFLDYQMLQALRVSVKEDNWTESIVLLREGIAYMREKGVYIEVISYHRLLALFLSLTGDYASAKTELDKLNHFFLFTEANVYERLLVELTKGSIAIHQKDYAGIRYARERLVEVDIEASYHYTGQLEVYLCLWQQPGEKLEFDLQGAVAKIWGNVHIWRVASEYDLSEMLQTLALAMTKGTGLEHRDEVEQMTAHLSRGYFKQTIEQLLAELH